MTTTGGGGDGDVGADKPKEACQFWGLDHKARWADGGRKAALQTHIDYLVYTCMAHCIIDACGLL